MAAYSAVLSYKLYKHLEWSPDTITHVTCGQYTWFVVCRHTNCKSFWFIFYFEVGGSVYINQKPDIIYTLAGSEIDYCRLDRERQNLDQLCKHGLLHSHLFLWIFLRVNFLIFLTFHSKCVLFKMAKTNIMA